MDHDPASGAGIILLQIFHQAAPAKCVQTLSHCSCINEVAATQAASDVGVYVPEFNLPGQHLWLLHWMSVSPSSPGGMEASGHQVDVVIPPYSEFWRASAPSFCPLFLFHFLWTIAWNRGYIVKSVEKQRQVSPWEDLVSPSTLAILKYHFLKHVCSFTCFKWEWW